MRRFEVAGRKYKLKEKEYRYLLKRFDLSKVSSTGDYFHVNVKCICPRGLAYSPCEVCPLGPLPTNCLNVLQKAELYPEHVDLGSTRIGWPRWQDEEARAEITRIREALLGLPREGK